MGNSKNKLKSSYEFVKGDYNMAMKVIYACLMGIVLTMMPAFAQEQQPPSAEDIIAKMQANLHLTPDQVTAISPILEKYSSKRDELHQSMEDGTADRDSIRTQMKQLRTDENQELSQVLSADQLNKWKQMQKSMFHHREGGGNGAPSAPGDNPPPPPQQ